MAAFAPSPIAVATWRTFLTRVSPQANKPGVFVAIFSSALVSITPRASGVVKRQLISLVHVKVAYAAQVAARYKRRAEVAVEATAKKSCLLGALYVAAYDVCHEVRLKHLQNDELVGVGVPVVVARIDGGVLVHVYVAAQVGVLHDAVQSAIEQLLL